MSPGYAIRWLLLALMPLEVGAAEWVRAGLNTNAPIWGRPGGLLFAIAPGGFLGGEPRGLIRLGYLYPDYREPHFAGATHFSRARLWHTPAGETLVAITSDELNPASIHPFPHSDAWYYGGFKVTQYWKKPPGTAAPGLEAVVNARFTYWQSRQPIPGGIAFENFELREPFHDGQEFVFGITRRTPVGLGFPSR